MTKFKALSFLQARDSVRETYGERGCVLLQAALSDAARAELYSDELLPTDWVDLTHCVEHTVVLDRVLGLGDGATSEALIRRLTKSQFAGLYRSVLATTPRAMLEKSCRLWSRYYDRGESTVEFHGPTHATKRILHCRDLPLHHDWILTPYYEELLLLCGASRAKARHVRCVALGAECCETEIRWEEAP